MCQLLVSRSSHAPGAWWTGHKLCLRVMFHLCALKQRPQGMLPPLGPLCLGPTTTSPGHPGGAGVGVIAHQGPVHKAGLGCTELPSCVMQRMEGCVVTGPLPVRTLHKDKARRRSRMPGATSIKQQAHKQLLSEYRRHATLCGSIKPLVLEFPIICPQIRWVVFFPPWLLIQGNRWNQHRYQRCFESQGPAVIFAVDA